MHDKPADAPPPLATASVLALLPLPAGFLLLPTGSFVWQTLGTALVLLGLYGVRLATRGRVPRRVRRALPYLVLTAVCVALLWPCLLGHMPLSHDHPVHLTRAWHFVTQNLAEGRLGGWSDLWLCGWPSGEDYPPLADWWIAAFFLGTFGLLGWEAAYAVAFFTMYLATSVAVYGFGRAHLGRAAGLAAGLFFLLDRGAYREGGWVFTVEWGVWPQTLSLAFTLLSLAALDRVLRYARPRGFAVCGACVACALLSHPVALPILAVAVPIYVAVRCLATREAAGPVAARTLGVTALGGALAAFWLVPFSAKSDWMIRHGKLWASLEEMAEGLWSGTLFGNVTPVLLWLGILGGAAAVYRRHWAGTFLGLLAAALLFLTSGTAFVELDYLDLSSAFGHITYKRLSLPIKVCFFLLAGYTLQLLFLRTDRPAFSWRRYALAGLLCLAVAPFVPALVQSWTREHAEDLGRLTTSKDIPHWNDYRKFLEWSADLKERSPEFYRIAYLGSRHDHFFMGAPVGNRTPLFKSGFTPALMFKHRPQTADRSLLRLLSVKWVVSLRELDDPSCEFERRFGSIRVYRFRDYSPERYTLLGPGKVELLVFEPGDERIRLRVSGSDGTTRLVLHVAPYANWRATVDGEPLEITTASLGGFEHFMSVAARDGLIEFSYVTPPSNLVGRAWTGLGLGLLGLLAWCSIRPSSTLAIRLGSLSARWGRRVERHGSTVFVVLLAGSLGFLIVRGLTADGSPGLQLRERLHEARVELVRGAAVERCERERSTRFRCAPERWGYVGAAALQVDKRLRRCIWAHPVEDAVVRVVFPDVELGRTLSGHHALEDGAVGHGAAVDLEVSIDGRSAGSFRRSDDKGWGAWEIDTRQRRGRRAEVAFEIRAADVDGRHYCFEPVVLP